MPDQDVARVIAPPPLIFFGALVLGLLLSLIFPSTLLPGALPWIIGMPLIAIGILLLASALVAMARAHTSPDISEPTRALVVSGPFRFTRNPIYVSFTLIYTGIAIAFNSLWAFVLMPLVLLAIDRGVIAREEKYLARRFGDEYLQYKARVQRWL